MSHRIDVLSGAAIRPLLPDLARLRMDVFREWPYLYDGSYDYERRYFAEFADGERSLVVTALDGGRVVGAATAAPLGGHAGELAAPLVALGLDPASVFYFGESVLLKSYRGRGIGHAFFDEREAFARRHGYAHAAFCAVVRPDNHPARPADYQPLDSFWRKRGFIPPPGAVGTLSWLDLGDSAESAKPMQVWLKAL